MTTYSPKPDHIERRWYVLDAGGQVLGRVASEAAVLLRGKHKPIYAPHMDTGDHVIIVNADKVELTRGKETRKYAYRHSGFPGGITATRYDVLLATRPVFAVEKAVRGMLPKNRLGRAMVKKLHVVAGPEHPHAAQKPETLAIGTRPRWEGFPRPEAVRPAPTRRRKTTDEAADSAGSSAAKRTAAKPTPTTRTATKKPAARKPAAKKPAARKPAAKTPAARKPAAKKPAAKRTTPTARKRKTEE